MIKQTAYSKFPALGLALFLFCSIFSGCERQHDPIKLGLSINLSGRGGTAGEYIRGGALLAVDEINNNGGIKGRPLQLIIKDDRNTPEGIIAADTDLIEQGVIAIVGHSYSQNTLVAYPVVTSRNTLLFTPYTGATELSGKDDLFIRTSVDNTAYGKALATLLDNRGIKRVGFLMDTSNPSFVEDYLKRTGRRYKGKIKAVRFNSKQNVAWDAIMDELLSGDPQALVLLTEVTMTSMAAQKLRTRGYTGDFIGTLWTQTPDLIKYGASAVEAMTIITFVDPEIDNPVYRQFSRQMQDHFDKPATARSVRAYEALHILANALRKCSANPTSLELKTTLLNNRFDIIMGPVSFDRFGDVIRPVLEVRVKDGKFVMQGRIM